jgi:hypothetical protein
MQTSGMHGEIDKDQILQVLTRHRNMILNVDMPLLFWWGGKETWTPNGLAHERT